MDNKQNSIEINKILIGENYPPYTIAEAGINHNGQLDLAYKMIDVAKSAGANAVKFQTFKAEEFVGDHNQTYAYQSQGKEINESMLEMFKRHEFSRTDWFNIKNKCDQVDITFLSTPANPSDLDLLLEIGIKAIKVGSDDFTNLPLLKKYVTTRLPIILSCGMADFAEVNQSLECVGALDGYPIVLLVCTSQYPTPPEDVNLLKFRTLSQAFPMITLGFSDHTQGPMASSIALGMGAKVFEKHFTLDNNFEGPDHWFSEDPIGIRNWIKSIKYSYELLGNSKIEPTNAEKEMRILARRSIVVIKDIDKDERLSEENIGLRRPGNGLAPSLFESLLGFRSKRVLRKGNLLQLVDVNNQDEKSN